MQNLIALDVGLSQEIPALHPPEINACLNLRHSAYPLKAISDHRLLLSSNDTQNSSFQLGLQGRTQSFVSLITALTAMYRNRILIQKSQFYFSTELKSLKTDISVQNYTSHFEHIIGFFILKGNPQNWNLSGIFFPAFFFP